MKRIFIMTALMSGSLLMQAQTPIKHGNATMGYELQVGNGHLGVEFVTPSIARVQYKLGNKLESNGTVVCVERAPQKFRVKLSEPKSGLSSDKESYVLSSDSLELVIDKKTGSIQYFDAKTHKLLLSEDLRQPRSGERIPLEKVTYDEKSARTVRTANGDITEKDVISRDTVGYSERYQLNLHFAKGEALYGLGAHMEDYMNLRGKTMYLCQHNLKAMVPVLNSTNGYGLLFDAGCGMKFVDSPKGASDQSSAYMELEAAKELDYYFMKGQNLDAVISNYRWLTGDVPMLPRYLTGYIQSKERYVSSADLLKTLSEFRKRHIPIDLIVQDWHYWPEGWGYMKLDAKRYPSAKNLADSVHAMNAKLMVSIWPNPQYCPEAEDFKSKGWMLEHSVYDAFNADARKHYWSYANNEFFSKDFDAWWCDCSEPLDGDWKFMRRDYGWNNHEERWQLNLGILSEACGAERASIYSLYHSMGIYENQRATSDAKRVVNLTRSAYAGQQRFSTINWNGDTYASWESFKRQIPAGLNYMATGCPYWTVDAGCFFTRGDGRWFYKGEFPQGVKDENYREFYTRMLQFATFLPLQRSHGSDTPREPWQFGEPGDQYYEAIRAMIDMRYMLTPYTYSLFAKTTREQYTMTRMLAFDYADDPEVLDIKDEFMYGPSFLVCPITEPKATGRKVYLPKGSSWTNVFTGETFEGGQWIDAKLPNGFPAIMTFPLYVKSGSIVPFAEKAEYTGEQLDKPLTLTVTPGSDATFDLYDDEGDNYNYEKGQYAIVPLKWDDAARTLTIGKRQGKFQGMQGKREMVVSAVLDGKRVEKTVSYDGKKISVKF